MNLLATYGEKIMRIMSIGMNKNQNGSQTNFKGKNEFSDLANALSPIKVKAMLKEYKKSANTYKTVNDFFGTIFEDLKTKYSGYKGFQDLSANFHDIGIHEFSFIDAKGKSMSVSHNFEGKNLSMHESPKAGNKLHKIVTYSVQEEPALMAEETSKHIFQYPNYSKEVSSTTKVLSENDSDFRKSEIKNVPGKCWSVYA